MMRSYIHTKFDKVTTHLRSLLPASEGSGTFASNALPASTVLPVCVQACSASPAASLHHSTSQHQVALSQASTIQHHHHHHAPVVGTLLRDAMHDKVHALAYIPETMKYALGDQVRARRELHQSTCAVVEIAWYAWPSERF